MIYFFIFILAILFAKCADSSYEKNKYVFLLFSLFALAPMIIIAGLRDVSVGTDTSMYPVTVYEFFNREKELNELIVTLGYIEPFYLLTGYVALVLLPNDVHSVLFLTNAITLIFFYIGFVKLRKLSPLSLSVFMFSFLCFNQTLNLQRQFLAMSIVFLGFTYLIRHNLIVYLLSVLLAFLCHKSAIVGLLLIPIFYYRNTKCDKILIFSSLTFLLLYAWLMKYFTAFAFFSKYEMYQQGGGFGGAFSFSEFILRLIFLYLFFTFSKKRKDSDLFHACKTAFICEFIINLLQVKSSYMGRLGYYLYDLYFVFIPYYICRIAQGRNKQLGMIILLISVILYWWYVSIFSAAGVTYPYTSEILGI